MKETPKQYIKRILGNLSGQHPLRVQAATPKKLERLVRKLTPSQMRRRPAKGKWSIAEILAHLADTELVGGYRVRTILSKNGTPIQAFDQDDWARDGQYARRDPKRSLATFRTLREANLALLKSLSAKKWSNYGMHAERGKETIRRVVEMFAGHDLNHLKQIEAQAKRKRG